MVYEGGLQTTTTKIIMSVASLKNSEHNFYQMHLTFILSLIHRAPRKLGGEVTDT